MSNRDIIIQKKVSRELFMKFLYQEAVLKSDWSDLKAKFEEFIPSVQDDAMEIHNSHGGRELDLLEMPGDLLLDASYLMDMVAAFDANREEIDSNINKFARKWTIDTLPIVDVAILRMAITEILYMIDIPDGITCDEAVNLAKKYCDDGAYKYINGILGSVVNDK